MVGKSNASIQNGKPTTRTIVVKCSSWKQKEKILKIACEKRVELTSRLTNVPNLQDYDIDEHLPSTTDSSYHANQDLSTFDTSPADLSFLHMNIRSLSCHFDELQPLLVNLDMGFNVVAVSDTWDSLMIPGYTFLSTRSKSQNGGVGLYVKTHLSPVPRLDVKLKVMNMRQFGVKLRMV